MLSINESNHWIEKSVKIKCYAENSIFKLPSIKL